MKLVVYTSFVEGGEGRTKVWAECEQSVRAWCHRMGATLVNLPQKDSQHHSVRTWVIFDAFRRSIEDGVDRAAWIDCDILVQEDAPDIFADLPDRHYYCQPDPVPKLDGQWRKNWYKFGAINPRPYMITSLVSWSPRHVEPLVSWFDTELEKKDDQNWRFKCGKRVAHDQDLVTIALGETETAFSYYPPHYHKMNKFANKNTPFMHAAGRRKPRKIRYLKSMIKKRKL